MTIKKQRPERLDAKELVDLVATGQLIRELSEIADKRSDGHFTVMRFTTNWRVGFYTPSDRDDIDDMCVGKTLEEAVKAAIFGGLGSPKEIT